MFWTEMEEMMHVLESTLNIDFIRGTISGPRKKEGIIKVRIRPLEKRGKLYFQLEALTKTQAFHENLSPEEAKKRIASYMEEFRQIQIETVSEDVTILMSRKGKSSVRRKKKQENMQKADLSHNRKKKLDTLHATPRTAPKRLKITLSKHNGKKKKPKTTCT